MKLDNIDEIEGIYVIKIWIKVVMRWMKLDDMHANQPIWMMAVFLTNAISSMSHFIHWIIKHVTIFIHMGDCIHAVNSIHNEISYT
jgi:hypothetical protein